MNKMNILIDKFLRKTSNYTHIIIILGGIYILFFGIFPIIDSNHEYWQSLEKWLGNITQRIDYVTIWLAALTFLYASRIWQRELHDNEEITIKLILQDDPSQITELPYKPIRRLCTRAEIQGILGVFYRVENKDNNYSTLGLSSPTYFKNLKEIELGETASLEIVFPKAEWERFKDNIDKFNQQVQ